MSRYFIELTYKGTRFSGFQRQENANTVQAEVEKAIAILHQRPLFLTGSSRTDAGVHALQNYFHFDSDRPLNPQFVYKMNAILPDDIVIRGLYPMHADAHSRFDAVSREYEYRISRERNPFTKGLALYFPYSLDLNVMQEAAAVVLDQSDFFAFTKSNTQVRNFNCKVQVSRWYQEGDQLIYNIKANRFLRGMVRLLTASQLKIGRDKMSVQAFTKLFKDRQKCGYSVPAEGLYLKKVLYAENYFP
jgi:tRNA pseudouridine38-40 synthase